LQIWRKTTGLTFVLSLATVTSLSGSEEAKKAHEDHPPSHSEVKPEAKHESPKRPQTSASECLVSESAIEDIKKGREANEARAKQLAIKETELKAKEQALVEQIKKLEELRDTISKVQQTKKAENTEKVAKLVETLLTMSPKAAARVLSSLEDDLAIEVMTQMDTQRLAKIMNLIEPARSSFLSEKLAGIEKPARHLSASHGAELTKKSIKKGGENKNEHDERSTNNEFKQSLGSQSDASEPKAEKTR
jgi:flagellar motility protein MotE (MotC chaperone)